jgi:hypothetical protein
MTRVCVLHSGFDRSTSMFIIWSCLPSQRFWDYHPNQSINATTIVWFEVYNTGTLVDRDKTRLKVYGFVCVSSLVYNFTCNPCQINQSHYSCFLIFSIFIFLVIRLTMHWIFNLVGYDSHQHGCGILIKKSVIGSQ